MTQRVTFEDLIGQYGPPPKNTIVLGMGANDKPAMLQFSSPFTMLIVGSRRVGRTNFLRTVAVGSRYILTSFIARVYTPKMLEWEILKPSRWGRHIVDSTSPEAVVDLSTWSRNKGPGIILVDDLDLCSEAFVDAFGDYLTKCPRQWVFATLPDEVIGDWMDIAKLFQSIVLGKHDRTAIQPYLALPPEDMVLEPGDFVAKVGGKMRLFSVPLS